MASAAGRACLEADAETPSRTPETGPRQASRGRFNLPARCLRGPLSCGAHCFLLWPITHHCRPQTCPVLPLAACCQLSMPLNSPVPADHDEPVRAASPLKPTRERNRRTASVIHALPHIPSRSSTLLSQDHVLSSLRPAFCCSPLSPNLPASPSFPQPGCLANTPYFHSPSLAFHSSLLSGSSPSRLRTTHLHFDSFILTAGRLQMWFGPCGERQEA